jgi:tetratricopeptide (TPR) repeat protein
MNQMTVALMFAAVCFCGTSFANGLATNIDGDTIIDEVNDNSVKTLSEPSLYQQGVEASHNNDFQKAVELFEHALQDDPNNPDILNMLAYSQSKTGKIDEALANYKRALKIRPYFFQAHEYLGEAYIQAALREIETLKIYGRDGKEQLEDLTKAIKEAGEKL